MDVAELVEDLVKANLEAEATVQQIGDQMSGYLRMLVFDRLIDGDAKELELALSTQVPPAFKMEVTVDGDKVVFRGHMGGSQ